MKFLIASDIHGSATWCRRLMEALDSEQPDRLLILGDILYHGPRNDLPEGYAPKEVISMLNPLASQIIAVRGNCDAEVDQMVLDFPCMADYTTIFDPAVAFTPQGTPMDCAENSAEVGRTLFLTHGHVYGAGFHNSVDKLPELAPGSVLLYGHTHQKVSEAAPGHEGVWAFNPGSASIPKDGTHSYGIYEQGALRHVELAE